MPVIRYEKKTPEHFQRCSWDSAITTKDEDTMLPNRMQRAASIAYPVDSGHQQEQPLLHLFLPNKVEYFCNSNRDHYSIGLVNEMIGHNENPRRHSSGNCDTTPQKHLYSSGVPPPIPARINKVPAIPKRRSLPKLPLENFPSSNLSPTGTTLENGINSPAKAKLISNSNIQVKLPPPPQPQSTHSKRTAAALARNKEMQASQSAHDENKFDVPNQSDTQKAPTSNGTFPEIKALTPLQNAALFNNLQNKSSEEGYFRFPKVGHIETFPGPNTEDSNFEPTYSHNRRKSGKKIPPPIHTYTNRTIDDPVDSGNAHFGDLSKAPTRHDSTLSCSDGGISQTSSPSYIVRSLESPLLPKVKSHSTNRHSKRKFITDKLFCDNNEFPIPKVSDMLTPPDLSKSQSTPAGLQTVVSYQQGSSLPYHHRVIKNDGGPSYLSTGQLKFQFVQIVINVIVLLVVCGSLATIFNLYPNVKEVHYVNNHTIINFQNVSHKPPNLFHPEHHTAEDGYLCVSLTARFCIVNNIPYNYTILPNMFGLSQRDADGELDVYEAITNVRCYQLAPLYLCSLYLPKCGRNGLPVKPCRNLCEETNRRCGLFLEVFGLQLPREVDCSMFPQSDNPDVCIGSKEVKDHLRQEGIIVCHDGFKCDKTRCIPADWRCDGHIDCEDETDEFNCRQCPGQLHCGMGKCIATSHICDGSLNCPWGQDERNCVRLNERMGDIGSGTVEVFVAKSKAFKTACIKSWDQQNSPRLMCGLLGYKERNYTELVNKSDNTQIQYIQYNKETVEENKIRLFHELKNCENDGRFPIVRALCSSYECGIRKESLGWPNTRIVGGTPSNPGDWPFLAAILGGPKEIFYCAGVLISDQWVLSAAHCVGNFNLSLPPVDWTIQLGMTRRSSHSYFGQKLKVVRVIKHPEYNQGIPHNNDIALFQLKERVKFHDHLLPVCMPNKTTVLNPPRNCTVIGWGKREDNDVSDYEPTVYEVQVPILSRKLCNNWLQVRDLNVSPGMICAGYEDGGKDACQGDSGGPLLCQDDSEPDKWFVGGIVSWGIKCAHPHLPGIYANVPRFVPWIEQQIKRYSDMRRY